MNKNDIRKFLQQKAHDIFYRVRPFTYSLMYYEDLVGCEIGTHDGSNAIRICKLLDIKEMYIIDPYNGFVQSSNEVEGINKNFDDLMISTQIKLRKMFPNIHFHWIKKYSSNAVDNIPKVDFVYIDGNHNYEFVKDDIENYFPKADIAIGGHDYRAFGVNLAVLEFRKKHNLKLYQENDDWWFKKV